MESLTKRPSAINSVSLWWAMLWACCLLKWNAPNWKKDGTFHKPGVYSIQWVNQLCTIDQPATSSNCDVGGLLSTLSKSGKASILIVRTCQFTYLVQVDLLRWNCSGNIVEKLTSLKNAQNQRQIAKEEEKPRRRDETREKKMKLERWNSRRDENSRSQRNVCQKWNQLLIPTVM